LKSLFESLNDQIRDINNNAYLLGQKPNFTPILTICQILSDLLDNSNLLNSVDYFQILLGFNQLPSQIECFGQINVNCMDKILNIGFIKELVNFLKLLINLQAGFFN
jgi:hypothetical protein